MRLTGHKWRTAVFASRLDGRDHRVVRPARVPAHAMFCSGYFGWHMSVDGRAARDLATAWWLAARSPHTLVHLPLRSSPATCGNEYGENRLDLVLLHHSLGFRPSRWKALRSRLTAPAAHTVTLPERAFRPTESGDLHISHHREFHDHLRWSLAADTLFIVGSRRAFELGGESLRGLAEDCPAHLAALPDTHCCAEIGVGVRSDRRDRNPYLELHVQLCNEHTGSHPKRRPAQRRRSSHR